MKETAYLLQAALVAAWWLGLVASRSFFHAFQFEGISEPAFWAFFLPDAVGIAGLSLFRVYRRSAAVEYIILGAFTYASLYCCNATLLTRSGYLPTGVMVLGLIYNLFLCFETLVAGSRDLGEVRSSSFVAVLLLAAVRSHRGPRQLSRMADRAAECWFFPSQVIRL